MYTYHWAKNRASGKVLIVVAFLLLASGVTAQKSALLTSMYPGPEPTLLAPELISTGQAEFHASFDTTTGELYFMRRTPGIFDYTIYCSRLTDQGWADPVVAPFSGVYRDAAPYIAPDGATLFFDSSRPDPRVAANSINLWKTQREGNRWSDPELLVAPSLNDADEPEAGRDEFGPAVDARGRLFFYSFRRPYRGGSHYLAYPPEYDRFERAPELPDPSARTFVAYLYLSPDGKIALLEGRAKSRGDRDLYCACLQDDGTWGEAVALSMVNSRSEEGQPALTPDKAFMLFTSNRPTGNPKVRNDNLYIIPAKEILRYCAEKSRK